MPALSARSSDPARNALMMSGPALRLTHSEISNGNVLSRPESWNWSFVEEVLEMLTESFVPGGTLVGNAGAAVAGGTVVAWAAATAGWVAAGLAGAAAGRLSAGFADGAAGAAGGVGVQLIRASAPAAPPSPRMSVLR